MVLAVRARRRRTTMTTKERATRRMAILKLTPMRSKPLAAARTGLLSVPKASGSQSSTL